MKYWTRRRQASFIIHTLFVLIPFSASSGSALLLWYDLLGNWWYAVPMVVTIDLLSLAGLILYIAQIESPFTALRHLLPFVSVGPLGVELSRLLRDNGNDIWVTVGVTAFVMSLFVWIAWRCFVTIERLFIDPVTAAKEKATQETERFQIVMTQAIEQARIINGYVTDWQHPVVTQPSLSLPELSTPDTANDVVSPDYDIGDIVQRIRNGVLSRAEAAAMTGKTERTILRWLAKEA